MSPRADQPVGVAEIARREGVSPQAVLAWIRDGCPASREGVAPYRLDPAAVRAWRQKHRPDLAAGISHGGRRSGAGRKPGNVKRTGSGAERDRSGMKRKTPGAKEAEAGDGPSPSAPPPEPVSIDEASLRRQLATGEITAAKLDLIREGLRALEIIRRSEIEQGRLIDQREAEQAWTRELAGVHTRLEQVAPRAAKAALQTLGLAPRLEPRLRGLIEAELSAAAADLAAGRSAGAGTATPPRSPAASSRRSSRPSNASA